MTSLNKTLIALAIGFTLPMTALASHNLYHITERLITPKGQSVNWTWQMLQTIPVQNNYAYASRSDSVSRDRHLPQLYSYENSFAEITSVTGYGTRAKPDTIVIHSGSWGYNPDEAFTQLSQVVNPRNLTKLNSNCNLKDLTQSDEGTDEDGQTWESTENLNYQNLYRWSRPQSEPLYIAEVSVNHSVVTGVFSGGRYIKYLITHDRNQLAKAIADHGWNTDAQGRTIACTFR